MNWVERTAQLRQWTRGGTRAPHKPLLFLYALSRFQQDADDELRYKGVLGLGEGHGEGHRILVSQSFVGHSTAAREHVIALAGRPLIGPQPGVRPIAAAHRSWHTSQVFHGSPRPATTA
ncbi:hypothetical protein AB0C61_09655 [Streptomyces sp. NPDC048680]|uniref:hypothetical protein n=1 Tax=Streptomyces sp. NPDC048680 TaxID=3155492 RepID=UPI003432F373